MIEFLSILILIISIIYFFVALNKKEISFSEMISIIQDGLKDSSTEKDGNKKDIKVLEVFWAGSDKQKFLMYVLNGYFFFLKEWKDHRFWYMEIENVPSPPSLKE